MPGAYNISVRVESRRMVSPQDAADHVGGETILNAMRKHWGLKPTIARRKLVRFDMKHLEAMCDRLEHEDLPAD